MRGEGKMQIEQSQQAPHTEKGFDEGDKRVATKNERKMVRSQGWNVKNKQMTRRKKSNEITKRRDKNWTLSARKNPHQCC